MPVVRGCVVSGMRGPSLGCGVRMEVEKLNIEELLIINNALNEVCHGPAAIPDWEFETRIGVNRAAAKRVLSRIQDALDKADMEILKR